jgi:fumarylacetoacetate (FAA) hydrolase
MRLASLDDGTRDGELIVVHPDGLHFARASHVSKALQAALDDWENASPRLRELSDALVAGTAPHETLQLGRLLAPLPRAYEWVDGSAYLSHIELVRKARGAAMPKTLREDPLVYQGGSGVLLPARAPWRLPDSSWGLDFEAELAVVLGDTPRGTSALAAASCIRLVMLANDMTYRNLVPGELEKGFGFFVSKPATAFSPFAVTPDELGTAYRAGRVHLPLRTYRNDTLVGQPLAGEEMHFSFCDLIAHITRTRAFTAGTIVGSGTVANRDPSVGVSCLAERRAREMIDHGEARTPFLTVGERVRIEMLDDSGRNVFGSIEQEVVAC